MCPDLMQSPAAQDGVLLYVLDQASVAQDGGQQLDLVESSAAQDAGQLHDLEQPSGAEDGGQQHDLMESSAAQHADQLRGLEQSSASEEGGQQHDLLESSAAQSGGQQHGQEHSVVAQDGSQLHDLALSSPPVEGDQQQDPVESPAAQEGAQQRDPVEDSAAQDGHQLHNLEHYLAAQHGDLQHDLEQCPAMQRGSQLNRPELSSAAHDEGQQRKAEHNAAGGASRPQGVADIIRRFDSGSVWGSPQQGAHVNRLSPGSPQHVQHKARVKKPLLDSIEHAQQSPRISALIPKDPSEEEHSSGPTESDLPVKDQGDDSPVSLVNPDRSLLAEGSLDQPRLEGHLRHASCTTDATLQPQLTGQGSFALPQLQGQGSSMRGDLWLPQLWLEPTEDMQGSTSPRKKMQKAMEAVRAAERAIEAASVFAPVRSGIFP